MEVAGLGDPSRDLSEHRLFGRRSPHVAQRGMCDALGVVHRLHGIAVDVAVGWKILRDVVHVLVHLQ